MKFATTETDGPLLIRPPERQPVQEAALGFHGQLIGVTIEDEEFGELVGDVNVGVEVAGGGVVPPWERTFPPLQPTLIPDDGTERESTSSAAGSPSTSASAHGRGRRKPHVAAGSRLRRSQSASLVAAMRRLHPDLSEQDRFLTPRRFRPPSAKQVQQQNASRYANGSSSSSLLWHSTVVCVWL